MKKELKINKIEVTTRKQLDKLYDSSALTLMGLDDTDKNLQGFAKWITSYSKIREPLNMYIISGNLMNKEYKLSRKK